MSLRVLAAASTKALCTLQSVKDRLGISGSSEDAKLTAFIAGASALIPAIKGRELVRQRYLQTLAGNGRTRLVLGVWPVDRDSVTLTIDDVAYTDFVVEQPLGGVLYRETGWPFGAGVPYEDPEENVAVTFHAGYVPPDLVKGWSANLVVVAGQFVQASSASPQPLLFEVTTAGTMAPTEPTWPTTAGTTVASGTAVLTARHALPVPLHWQEAALLTVLAWRSGATAVAPNVASERFESSEIAYFAGTAGRDSALPRAAQVLIEAEL